MNDMVKQAQRELEEDGVLHADTDIAPYNPGIDPDAIIEEFTHG